MGSAAVTHASWGALDTSSFHARFEDALDENKPQRGTLLVGGSLRHTSDGALRHSPGDPGIEIGSVFEPSPADVRAAFVAAVGAFDVWRHLPVRERAQHLGRFAELIDRERFSLAASLSLEIGKNRFEAMTEVEEAIALIDFYAAQGTEANNFLVPLESLNRDRSVSALRPYGPWAVFAPANFPIALLVGMTAAALITGNTVVAKPPEDGSITASKLAELASETDLPPGILNLVPGGEAVGKQIASHDDLAGIAFTGSSRVGHELMLQQARRGQPIVAEMGGKNAAIVTATADLDTAATGIAQSAFRYSGQKCSACSRAYVDSSVFDSFVDLVSEHARSLHIGAPWLRDSQVGALINRRASERYAAAIAAAAEEAETSVTDLPADLPSGGAYAAPALVVNIRDDHWVARDELFLPVLCIQPIESFDEGLERANSSAYGLTAGIYTSDDHEVGVFFDKVQAGVAYANRAAGATTGAWPRYQSFGGWKGSSASGKNAHGPYYLHLFMREQCQTRSV